MEQLKQQSLDILKEDPELGTREVQNWMNWGDILLGRYSEGTSLCSKDQEVQSGTQYLLELGLVTEDEIIGYHGNCDIIVDGDLTDKFLSVTRCIGVALNFGEILKVRIPKGIPAFYISSEAILQGRKEYETEMEILLPQGRWKIVSQYEEKCQCGFPRDFCHPDPIMITEVNYEPL